MERLLISPNNVKKQFTSAYKLGGCVCTVWWNQTIHLPLSPYPSIPPSIPPSLSYSLSDINFPLRFGSIRHQLHKGHYIFSILQQGSAKELIMCVCVCVSGCVFRYVFLFSYVCICVSVSVCVCVPLVMFARNASMNSLDILCGCAMGWRPLNASGSGATLASGIPIPIRAPDLR